MTQSRANCVIRQRVIANRCLLGKVCTSGCAERLAESGHDNRVQRMDEPANVNPGRNPEHEVRDPDSNRDRQHVQSNGEGYPENLGHQNQVMGNYQPNLRIARRAETNTRCRRSGLRNCR